MDQFCFQASTLIPQNIYTPFQQQWQLQMAQSYYTYLNSFWNVNNQIVPQIIPFPCNLTSQNPTQFYDGTSCNNIKTFIDKEQSEDGTKRVIQNNYNQVDVPIKNVQFNFINFADLEQALKIILDGDFEKDELLKQIKNNDNTKLLKIIENILKKQKSQLKSREELIKFCLRKAFRYIFKQIQDEHQYSKLNLKGAQKIFSKQYLNQEQTQMILPFRKNSKNKTMNVEFLSGIFSQQSFANSYKEFLSINKFKKIAQFDQIVEKDVNKKLRGLSKKIHSHLTSDKKIHFEAKRLPWSKKNIEKVKLVAHDLLTYSNLSQQITQIEK